MNLALAFLLSFSVRVFAHEDCGVKLAVESRALELAVRFAKRASGETPKEYLKKIPLEEAEQTIVEVVDQVDELRFIKEFADSHGVRAWLLGGSATSLAAFRRGQILRLLGDPEYASDRFGIPHFSNIFRSIQDMDIVIDAKIEVAEKLERMLKEKFPYLRTDKSIWEVRLLRDDRMDKMSLLENPDYTLANNDTLSTWLMELTTPPAGERASRDLLNWKGSWKPRPPAGLEDIWNGRIQFMRSPKHFSTSRAKQGNNPELLSVVRFLTKVFQYGYHPSVEDMNAVSAIVESFEMEKDLGKPGLHTLPYPYRWLRWASKKLFKSPVNVELASNTLESVGLRSLIQNMTPLGTPSKAHSAPWWLSKEPLRSYPLGEHFAQDPRSKLVTVPLFVGPRAVDLGLAEVRRRYYPDQFVYHELLKYGEAGSANVFVERKSVPEENPGFESGFPTVVKLKNETSIHADVVFKVNPNARLGIDFIRKGNEVIFLNKNALSPVEQSFNWDIKSYFGAVFINPGLVSKTDKSFLSRIRLDIQRQLRDVRNKHHLQWLMDLIEKELRLGKGLGVSFEVSKLAPEMFNPIHIWLLVNSPHATTEIFESVSMTFFANASNLRMDTIPSYKRFVNRMDIPPEAGLRFFVKYAMTLPAWLEKYSHEAVAIVGDILAREDKRADRAIVRHILGNPKWWEMQPDACLRFVKVLRERKDYETAKRLRELPDLLKGKVPKALRLAM